MEVNYIHLRIFIVQWTKNMANVGRISRSHPYSTLKLFFPIILTEKQETKANHKIYIWGYNIWVMTYC